MAEGSGPRPPTPSTPAPAVASAFAPLPPAARDALHERLRTVRSALAEAQAARQAAGPDVTLLAVGKRHPPAALTALYDAGIADFGENYLQELEVKAHALAQTGRRPRWHFIGGLQGNKLGRIAAVADVVHSLAERRHVVALGQAAHDAGRTLDVLLQVNLDDAPAPTRHGCLPDRLPELVEACQKASALRLRGLMLVPPRGVPPAPYFDRLRALSVTLRTLAGAEDARALCMGMSADFASAIAAGATMVRLGTALLGPRPPP